MDVISRLNGASATGKLFSAIAVLVLIFYFSLFLFSIPFSYLLIFSIIFEANIYCENNIW